MFQIKDKVVDIVDNVEDIAKTYYRLSVVRVADKSSKLGASLLVTLLIFALMFFALFFACFGLSWWVGVKLNNHVLGFFIVSGGLFLVLLLILLLKRKVIKVIRNIIIQKIYG